MLHRMLSIGLIAFVSLIGGFGCGGPASDVYPVNGIVQFPDGKLLRSGTVEFELIGQKDPITATARISPDGTFTMGTYQADDGALVGNHRVVVLSDYEIGNGAERPGLIPESLLDAKYRSYRTSGLQVEVKPETNNVVLEVRYAKDGT
ncbi:hypothetical protein [Rubripirellula reticaptiva]|uniref:Carboxypeptidase regulatory-like domain-containing protein n=1 Tax=Rubripirellula reticaptiva TaxID=2528013 RepID=A0A5C6EHZ1_9BACT|nr:hypothetical protein [Rubripirellula reticaptiva]TWU47667.1 hypothetical protein Poly59_45080 [Rubripirellula reticaptiva]